MSDADRQRWPARFFDAASASGSPVRVHLNDRGIVISATAQSEELVWPFGALRADPLIAPGADAATVYYKYMPDARLEVASPTFGPLLGQHAPQIMARRWPTQFLKLAILGAVVGIAIWMIVALVNSQPSRLVASLIPENARQSLGRTVIASMAGRHRACVSPDGEQALQRLTERLLGQAITETGLKVTVVDWSLVNAFAAPGGQLLLTQGLIQAATSPEEVAGVLAHEIGHSIELHPEAGIVRSVGIAAVIDLITGGGDSLSGLGNVLLRNRYARQDERSADEQALRLLRRAKIGQTGLANFFLRIGRQQGAREGQQATNTLDGLFRTHPYPLERAARVRRSARYHSTPALTASEWRALKQICQQTRPFSES